MTWENRVARALRREATYKKAWPNANALFATNSPELDREALADAVRRVVALADASAPSIADEIREAVFEFSTAKEI